MNEFKIFGKNKILDDILIRGALLGIRILIKIDKIGYRNTQHKRSIFINIVSNKKYLMIIDVEMNCICVKERGFLKKWNFYDRFDYESKLTHDIFGYDKTDKERANAVSRFIKLKAFL